MNEKPQTITTKKYGRVTARRQEPLFGSGSVVSFVDKSGFTFEDETQSTGRYKVLYFAEETTPRPTMAEKFLEIVKSAGTMNNLSGDDEKKIIAAARELATPQEDDEQKGAFDWSAAGVNHRRASRKK